MKQLCLVIVAACVFSACKSPTTPTEITYNHVSLSDAFTFDNYELTSSGGVAPGTRDTSVLRIDAVGLTMDGKSNIFRTINTSSDTATKDTNYYCYEADNNLSMMIASPFTNAHIWIKLPAASNGTYTTLVRDTVVEVKGTTIESDSMVTTAMGNETMTIAGTDYTVRKIRGTFRTIVHSPTVNIDISQAITGYYSPTFGILVRTSADATGFSPATEERLIGHSVK